MIIEEIRLNKGEIIESPAEYIVLSGYLVCRLSKMLIYFIQPGDQFSVNYDFFDGAFNYEAKGNVVLSRINPITVRKKRLMDKEICLIMERIDFFTLPIKNRMLTLLYQAAKEIGVVQGNKCILPNILTHQEWANYTGCTREYLSELRRKLIEEGLIEKDRRWILKNWDEWNKLFFRMGN